MQVLSLGYLGTPVSAVTSSAFKACRRVDVTVKIAVPQVLLLVTLIAIFVSHGILAVAACQTAVRILFVPIGVYVATRVLGLRTRELWTAAWPALAAAAAMMAVMVTLQHAIASPWVALLTAGALGAAVYVGLIWLLERDALRGLWRRALGARALQTRP
jgi:O-antigen/teichoic acid export membrane protein